MLAAYKITDLYKRPLWIQIPEVSKRGWRQGVGDQQCPPKENKNVPQNCGLLLRSIEKRGQRTGPNRWYGRDLFVPTPSLRQPLFSGVEKLTRSSLKGFLNRALFAYKNGRFASSLLLLGIGLLQASKKANLSFKSPSPKPHLIRAGSGFALPIFETLDKSTCLLQCP